MPAKRTLSAAARELQAAANRLSLAKRNEDRDNILAVLFSDLAKGKRAAARLEANAKPLKALEDEVARLRAELRAMLDALDPKSSNRA